MIPSNTVVNAPSAPYHAEAVIADAPLGIGTGMFPTKVINPHKGLLPTLTSHSWPWIPDNIRGNCCKRLITHLEVQHAYSLKLTWENGAPALDEAFWRRQFSQCILQNMANACTHALQSALTTPDAEGLTPWKRLQTH